MGLKVWLPLNEDLHNQGYTNIKVENFGAIVSSAGKIGKCYAFNGSSTNYLRLPPILTNTDEFSIAFWVKNTAINTNYCYYSQRVEASGTGYTIFYISGQGVRFDDGSSLQSPVTFAAGTWHHVVCCRNSEKKYIYIDGILSISGNKTNTSANKVNSNYSLIGGSQSNSAGSAPQTNANLFNGGLNDYRIYDHCLSAAEVREISQGLVLHYKLDGFMSGTHSNLAQGSKLLATASSLTNCNISKRGSPTIETRTDGFVQVKGIAAWQGFSLWSNSLNLKVGTTYTYSFYGYTALSTSTNASISFYPMMYNSAGTRDTSSTLPISVMGGAFTNSNAKQIGKLNTTPQLYWATFTWNQTMADIIANGGKIELSIQIHGTFDTGRIDYLWAPKLELGDKPTTWTPSIEEMGIDPTKIEDSSGYNHNGTILNTVSISSDTPRYSCSTKLEAANSMINCGRGGMVTDSITVNIWIKSSSWANPVSCTEGGGWNFEAVGDYFRFPIYISGVGYKYGQSTTTRAQICNNQWHMLTGIYDRINQKVQIYIDGQLDNDYSAGTSNNIGYNGSNVIWIGAEATGSNTTASNGMAGLFSDFRIYATALDVDAIRQLYEVGAKVDNKQNLHAFELVEDNSKIQITKQGQVKCNELEEDEKTKFYQTDQIIETNEIIEL